VVIDEEGGFLQKEAWDYFQLHASQRLTTFNFYIIISSVITTGLFGSFQGNYRILGVGMILGLLLVLFSFVFWKLDGRNRELIKNAEAVLRFFESATGIPGLASEAPIATVFLREQFETTKSRGRRSFLPWRRHYSYSDCFNTIFFAFGVLGLGGFVLALAAQIWQVGP
jgi:hypothetical protein